MLTKRQPPDLPRNPCGIPLGHGRFATVDPWRYDELSKHRWFAKKSKSTWYAVRKVRTNGHEHLIRMHRQITNCPPDKQVHHLNRNGLDNRDHNMLCCHPWEHKLLQNS